MDFNAAQKLFAADKIRELSQDPSGLRYLKLRSLSRGRTLVRLFETAAVQRAASAAGAMFREAFDSPQISLASIDATIRDLYEEQRALRRLAEPELVSQLYRLQEFNWGGLHQNSLEKTIVDNYVKKITSYDTLSEKIDNELQNSLRGYVLCSWYNHWTSIIIEDVFRDHPRVVPAIGQVKKIDFFIDDVPFDLKVTYFPEGFVKQRRRSDGLRPELTLLRQFARRNSVHFDQKLAEARLLEDLWLKISDFPGQEAQTLVADLHGYRVKLLQSSKTNPLSLITWLYENQGVRRFDASNRLFLVLVDPTHFFASWKLKRAKPLLDRHIHTYLDSLGTMPGKELTFEWEGSSYATCSDTVFVIRDKAKDVVDSG
jgi:hypothetical protein